MLKLCVFALIVAYAYAGEDDGFCVCKAYGKYHYQTFDGAFIRFDGKCGYTLSKSKSNAEKYFRINVYNKGSGDQYQRSLAIKLGSTGLLIKQGNVYINGIQTQLPYSGEGGINISMEGPDIKVYLAWMLTILFDNKLQVTIKVPESYSNKMFGICGDCNKNATDDFREKLATLIMPKSITAEIKIGKSYRLRQGSTADSKCPVTPVVSKCDANKKCFKMWADTFKPCQKVIGSKKVFNLMESCKVDVCMSNGQTKAMCIAYERLAQECLRRSISIKWKAIVGCETPCDKKPCKNNGTCDVNATNTNYTCKCTKDFVGVNCEKKNQCAQNPCKNMGICIVNESTGKFTCQCTNDFVGEKCETDSPCLKMPCVNGGTCTTKKLPVGKYLCSCSNEYFGNNCEKEDRCTNNPCGDNGYCTTVDDKFQCTCKTGYVGKICDKVNPCESNPCKNGGFCNVTDSAYKCLCKKGFKGASCQDAMPDCVCRVFGDPHYITFDGQLIHFMGKCKYTLAATKTSSKLPQFSVEVKNHHRGNTRVSHTRIVDLKFNGNTFRMLPGSNLKVNGFLVTLPLTKYMEVNATFSLGWVTVMTDFGLKVAFDGVHRVIVTVSSIYIDELTGICGECNQKKDDYKTKSGYDVSSSKNRFSLIGASYEVVDDSDKPEKNCTVVDYIANCPPTATTECDALTLPTGPFSKCLNTPKISATLYLEACRTDVCAYKSFPKIVKKVLCQAYEAFALECQNAGVFTKWRKKVGCETKCDSNQFYMFKSTLCQLNCLDLPVSCDQEYGEGCVCKRMNKFMGNVCVQSNRCGCNYKGMGVKAYTTMLAPDCSETVSCSARGRWFPMEGCQKNEDCLFQSSKRVCQCSPPFKKLQNKCLAPTLPEEVMTSALAKFVRVTMAYIEGTSLKTISTNRPEVCAVICLNNTECKSFNFDEMKDECNLFSVNAVNKTLVTVNCPFQDYYQLIESKNIVIRGGSIFPCGPLTEYAVVKSLEDCKAKCTKNNCKSIEYSLADQECSISNSTGKNFELNGDDEFVYYGYLD